MRAARRQQRRVPVNGSLCDTVWRMERFVLNFCAALIMGCGASSQAAGPAEEGGPEGEGARKGAWAERATSCGASALMPAPVREKSMREGPVIARIAWGIDRDGSRYEIACFDMPEKLADADRDALLDTIAYRLGNNAGVRVTERERAQVGDEPAVRLSLAVPPDRSGRYWIFVQRGRRLFEVSVVGPQSERLTKGAEKFFNGFRLGELPSDTRGDAREKNELPSDMREKK